MSAIGITLTKPLVGASTRGTNPANAIILPAHETHADRIFSGTPSSLDDHFDGSTLDAKWTPVETAGAYFGYKQLTVAGSKLNIGGHSHSSADNVTYAKYVWANLPNSNTFTIIISFDVMLASQWYAGSFAAFEFAVTGSGASGETGVWLVLDVEFGDTNKIIYGLYAKYGLISAPSLWWYTDPRPYPKYFRIEWNQTTRDMALSYSSDGIAFMGFSIIPAAYHGLTSGYNPTWVYLINRCQNGSTFFTQIDWIKFTNP